VSDPIHSREKSRRGCYEKGEKKKIFVAFVQRYSACAGGIDLVLCIEELLWLVGDEIIAFVVFVEE
jgi:hypothetical protein